MDLVKDKNKIEQIRKLIEEEEEREKTLFCMFCGDKLKKQKGRHCKKPKCLMDFRRYRHKKYGGPRRRKVEEPLFSRPCEVCGKEIFTNYKNKKYCSVICIGEAEATKRRAKAKQTKKTRSEYEIICVVCGKKTIVYRKTQITCGSKECIKKRQKLTTKKWNKANRQKNT